MKRLITTALLLLSVLFVNIPAYAETIETSANSYILVDAKTGQVLSEKDADKKSYPASTTKILTAIVAIETGDLKQMMTASKEAVKDIGPDGMNIFIAPGEELQMEDLLNAMLIASANETANIIAENLAPTRKDYIDKMNAKAKELGANNTHFTNPNGMHDDDHYTTARDLSILACYAMSLPKFREITAKKSYLMNVTNMHKKWDMLYTTNKFLYTTSEYFSKITGIKSGYTSQAGYNLVSSAMNDDGMELIAVVFGDQSKAKVDTDSKKLLEYGFENYSLQKVIAEGQFIKNVPVKDAKDNVNVNIVVKSDFSCVLPKDSSEWNIDFSDTINSKIQAPVNKGDVLGYREYRRNGAKLGKVDLVAAGSVEKIQTQPTKLKEKTGSPIIFSIIKYILLAAFALFALRFILRRISRSMKARRRRNLYQTKRRLMK